MLKTATSKYQWLIKASRTKYTTNVQKEKFKQNITISELPTLIIFRLDSNNFANPDKDESATGSEIK